MKYKNKSGLIESHLFDKRSIIWILMLWSWPFVPIGIYRYLQTTLDAEAQLHKTRMWASVLW